MLEFPDYKKENIKNLIPYVRNSRTHSPEQVAQIAASIKEFGFTNPILIDDEGGIIAGHGRVLAAQKLGMEEVPVIVLSHLTEAQKRAYVIADNKLALNAGWDDELLRLEFSELDEAGFDLELTGFSLEEIDALEVTEITEGLTDEDVKHDNPYTDKVDGLIYEPTGIDIPPSDAYNGEKVNELLRDIQASSVPDDIKGLLLAAATRHYVFDYSKIAEIYSNSNQEVKNLMEKSALVIVDYGRAIELGYAKIRQAISDDMR